MIRVFKVNNAPAILTGKGRARRNTDCVDYDADSDKYRSGQKKFQFDSRIYGDTTVKDLLKKNQHDKCCYCESRFASVAYGDVEHFRPKAYSINKKSAKRVYPGYYWLCYEWTNLLFSCEICNRTYKKNYFPLISAAQRARNHNDNLGAERSFLVNPGHEDPREHIRFNGDAPTGITNRGTVTIGFLGLDRSALTEDRLKLLDYPSLPTSLRHRPPLELL